MGSLTQLDLPDVSPDEFRRAIRVAVSMHAEEIAAPSVGPKALSGRLPSTDKLKDAVGGKDEDAKAAEYFTSLLEVAYLVASADGLGDDELAAMTELVSHATGAAADKKTVEAYFADAKAASEALGRRERLARAASSFDDFMAREEAMSFAAIISIADGKLDSAEARALLELGEFFELSAGEVQAVVDQVVATVKSAIKL